MRFTNVGLFGFKGISSEYRLDPATALEGPMGAGKSACLEAIRYALSGEVPTGKKDDLVADYFPADGGHVVLMDAKGRWIKRGIRVDRRKQKKVTRILETSDTAEGAKEADLSAWGHTSITIDIAKFIALSPEKRRQFILGLCGSTERASASVIDQVGIEFAKAIGGKAADTEFLGMDAAELTDRGFDEWDIARLMAWSAEAGICETLQAELVGDLSISEAASKLLERASKELMLNRRLALDARAACTELESAAATAAPLAAQVEDLRRRLDTARGIHVAEVEAAARIAAADEAVAKATARLEGAKATADTAQDTVSGLEDAGREPAAPPQRAPKKASEFQTVSHRVGELDALIGGFESLKAQAASAGESVEKAETNLANHREADTGRLVAAWAACYTIPGFPEADEEIAAMDDAVEAISVGWKQGLKQREAQLSAAVAGRDRLAAEVAQVEGDERSARDERRRLVQERDRLSGEVSQAEAKHQAAMDEYRRKKAAWKARKQRREEAALALEKAKGELAGAEEALEAARVTRSHQGSEVPDPDGTAKEVSNIEAQIEDAQKAAGAVTAYKDAVARSRNAEILEAAWSIAQQAIRLAREALIAELTDPIVEDLNGLMPTGCQAFLELEDERGSPAFRVGMIIEGTKIDVGPLSDGWSTIFLSALSIAICRRSKGRKILFVEGDHLDGDGLPKAMELLAPCAAELDALILATSRPIPKVMGWTVSDIAHGGLQKIREEAAA